MKRKFHEEESLIAKAKAEYLKKTLPKDRLTPGGGGECILRRDSVPELCVLSVLYWNIMVLTAVLGTVISDPNDPKFDLEAYLKMAEVSK